MGIAEATVGYGLFGLVAAMLVLRRDHAGRRFDAAVCVFLWPIWLPIALWREPTEPLRAAAGADPRVESAAERVVSSLRAAHRLCEHTPLSAVLSARAVEQIEARIELVLRRHLRLCEELAEAVPRAAHAGRQPGGGEPTRAARLVQATRERLIATWEQEIQALEELADLAEALRAQLLWARFGKPSELFASDIVTELWARLEGLAAVNEDPVPVV